MGLSLIEINVFEKLKLLLRRVGLFKITQLKVLTWLMGTIRTICINL